MGSLEELVVSFSVGQEGFDGKDANGSRDLDVEKTPLLGKLLEAAYVLLDESPFRVLTRMVRR